MPVPATLTSPGKPGDFASDGTDLYIYTGTGRPPHSWIVAGSGGGSGIVTSVNGNTGAVTVKPLTTVAPLASAALTLSQDGVVRTNPITSSQNFTLASAGNPGDFIEIESPVTGTQTVTTSFPVFRKGATVSENISQSFTGRASITIRNLGDGVIQWWDNNYGASDLPVAHTATNYTPSGTSAEAHFTAIDAKFASVGGGALVPGVVFGWATADLASKPTNSIVADGANGTVNAGTFASGAGTWLQMGNGTVAAPTFSPVAGTYEGSQNITISTTTPSASIYFRTDGVDPTTSDTLYSSPVTVAATGSIKAKAYKSLYDPSTVQTAAYTITSSALLSDDLVYASGGAATTGGWTHSSATWNYTTSPAPLVGLASSLRVTWGGYATRSFTSTADVWVYVVINCEAVTANTTIFEIQDSSGSMVCRLFRTSAGDITLYQGSTISSTTALSVGTTGHYWFHYVAGTGANGIATLYRSTTGTKGSPLISITNGTATASAEKISLKASGNSNILFNKLRVKDTSIGDNGS